MKKRIFYLILLTIIVAFICPHGAIAFRQVPDNNLSYPVLIMVGKSAGSGFFLQKENKIYFVTARHVLYKPTSIEIKSLPKEIKIPDSIRIRLKYDNKTKMLTLHGVMSAEDKKILLELWQDQSYRSAIEKMYKSSQMLYLKNKKALLLSYALDINEDSVNTIALDLNSLNEGKKIRYHRKKDVAIITMGETEDGEMGDSEKGRKTKFIQGVLLLTKAKTGIVSLDAKNFKTFKEAMIGNDIFLFGFPSSIGLRSPEFNIHRPLIKKGILSGKNPKFKTLIIDCPVHRGNSGSLVIEKEEKGLGNSNFYAIGIAIRYVPVFEKGVVEISSIKEFTTYSNSGYSIVEPIDTVFEMLKN